MEKEDLDTINNLQLSGAFNHVHAKYLSAVSDLALNNNIEMMKPTRTLKKTTADKLSAHIVQNYLRQNGLELTLKTLDRETNGELDEIASDENINFYLNLESTQDQLKETLNNWIAKSDEILAHNHAKDIKTVEEMVKKTEQRKNKKIPSTEPRKKARKTKGKEPASEPNKPKEQEKPKALHPDSDDSWD